MNIIKKPAEMIDWSKEARSLGHTIALVPTMGYFHDGHVSLMREAGKIADKVVVSLFVNPTQFGPGEDLDSYPRDFDKDRARAQRAGVEALFYPDPDQMYPQGFASQVVVSGITDKLCGKSRPHHFAGVTTVVNKLLNIVQPHLALFGEKDFQQLAVIKRMVKDLNMPVKIIGHPIVREQDGLAMSSRNAYLDKKERQQALCLWHSIQEAKRCVKSGEFDCLKIKEIVRDTLMSHGHCQIDYIEFINKDTLESCARVDDDVVLALAVYIGKTRLIDNDRLLRGDDNV